MDTNMDHYLLSLLASPPPSPPPAAFFDDEQEAAGCQQQADHSGNWALPCPVNVPAPLVSCPSSEPSSSPSSSSSTHVLHASLAATAADEDSELQSMLRLSEQQLARMRQAAPKKYVDGAKTYAAAVQRMARVVDELAATIAQRAALRRRDALLHQQLALVEREERRLAQAPAAPAPQPWALPRWPAGTQPPPSSGELVSVHQLPPAGGWDAGWEARVRGMRVLDLLLLRRQWLQFSAIRLPRASVLRHQPQGDAAAAELRDLYGRFADFIHRVLLLNPKLWHEAYRYDLDSLQPLDQGSLPSQEHYESVPAALEKAMPVQAHFQRVIGRLRAEEAALQGLYARLAGSTLLAGPTSSRAQVYVEADKVLAMIDANLHQQKLQVANFVHAVNYALPIEQALALKLSMYPLAHSGQLAVNLMYTAPLPEL